MRAFRGRWVGVGEVLLLNESITQRERALYDLTERNWSLKSHNRPLALWYQSQHKCRGALTFNCEVALAHRNNCSVILVRVNCASYFVNSEVLTWRLQCVIPSPIQQVLVIFPTPRHTFIVRISWYFAWWQPTLVCSGSIMCVELSYVATSTEIEGCMLWYKHNEHWSVNASSQSNLLSKQGCQDGAVLRTRIYRSQPALILWALNAVLLYFLFSSIYLFFW